MADESDSQTARHMNVVQNPKRTVSMSDVAQAVGVSQQTVSRVANGKTNVSPDTRKRVLKAMHTLGFRPNYAGRSLRQGSYHAVGLYVYDITEIGNFNMLKGILEATREPGYAVTMLERPEGSAFSLSEVSQRMAALPVDGMVIGMSRMATDFNEFVPQPGMNTVIVTMYSHPRCTTVDSDQYGCSYLVMNHLYGYGHRQIRFVAGPVHSIDSQFRERGWRDFMRDHDLELHEPIHGDWTANGGYEIGAKLAQDKQMTAIYVANDQMAMGVIAALRDAGLRVPEDISVVGVDDALEKTVPNVGLTTVRFDLVERGRVVFENVVNGPTGHPLAIRIPGKLIKRRSVAPAHLRT